MRGGRERCCWPYLDLRSGQLAYLRSIGGKPLGAAAGFARTCAKLSSWLIFDLREAGQWAPLLALCEAGQLAYLRSMRGVPAGAPYLDRRKAGQLAYLRSIGGGPLGAATGFARAYVELPSWLIFDLSEAG